MPSDFLVTFLCLHLPRSRHSPNGDSLGGVPGFDHVNSSAESMLGHASWLHAQRFVLGINLGTELPGLKPAGHLRGKGTGYVT